MINKLIVIASLMIIGGIMLAVSKGYSSPSTQCPEYVERVKELDKNVCDTLRICKETVVRSCPIAREI